MNDLTSTQTGRACPELGPWEVDGVLARKLG
jgi:hypothetical protein